MRLAERDGASTECVPAAFHVALLWIPSFSCVQCQRKRHQLHHGTELALAMSLKMDEGVVDMRRAHDSDRCFGVSGSPSSKWPSVRNSASSGKLSWMAASLSSLVIAFRCSAISARRDAKLWCVIERTALDSLPSGESHIQFDGGRVLGTHAVAVCLQHLDVLRDLLDLAAMRGGDVCDMHAPAGA